MCSFISSIDTLIEPIGYEVFSSDLHGNGVKSTLSFNTGDIVFTEPPMCCLQTLPNKQDVVVCGYCHKFIGSIGMQIDVVQKVVTRQDTLMSKGTTLNGDNDYILSDNVISCQAECGEVYCSNLCQELHWNITGHKLLCTGMLTDYNNVENHPLIQFKTHAVMTNEIFLLVADVFSKICCDIEQGASIDEALHPWSDYCRNLWEEVAIVPKESKEDPKEFSNTLNSLISDSWLYLSDTLDLKGRGLDNILTKEYMSR